MHRFDDGVFIQVELQGLGCTAGTQQRLMGVRLLEALHQPGPGGGLGWRESGPPFSLYTQGPVLPVLFWTDLRISSPEPLCKRTQPHGKKSHLSWEGHEGPKRSQNALGAPSSLVRDCEVWGHWNTSVQKWWQEGTGSGGKQGGLGHFQGGPPGDPRKPEPQCNRRHRREAVATDLPPKHLSGPDLATKGT